MSPDGRVWVLASDVPDLTGPTSDSKVVSTYVITPEAVAVTE